MFELTQEQKDMVSVWCKERYAKQQSTTTAGGRYTYCFTPTGIGTIAILQDCITKKEIDLTDYDNW